MLEYIAKIGGKANPRDLEVLSNLQRVESMLGDAGQSGKRRSYIVQPDGSGGKSISLMPERPLR